uniref:Uncharacterized protein n=1 Tax=Branchiostoma floridae TaxID=7739 RepID=C3ZUX1_BRAFL|eukprot:XP_002587641.1 hypothetical protein BRAFLDRAFT_96484 [Branchiostoma floridae]
MAEDNLTSVHRSRTLTLPSPHLMSSTSPDLAAGCKRTAKSELIRLEIVQKVKDTDPAIPPSDVLHFSRPGSAYVMRSQPLRGQRARDVQMDAAAASGDVLMSAGHRITSKTQPAFNLWRT